MKIILLTLCCVLLLTLPGCAPAPSERASQSPPGTAAPSSEDSSPSSLPSELPETAPLAEVCTLYAPADLAVYEDNPPDNMPAPDYLVTLPENPFPVPETRRGEDDTALPYILTTAFGASAYMSSSPLLYDLDPALDFPLHVAVELGYGSIRNIELGYPCADAMLLVGFWDTGEEDLLFPIYEDLPPLDREAIEPAIVYRDAEAVILDLMRLAPSPVTPFKAMLARYQQDTLPQMDAAAWEGYTFSADFLRDVRDFLIETVPSHIERYQARGAPAALSEEFRSKE